MHIIPKFLIYLHKKCKIIIFCLIWTWCCLKKYSMDKEGYFFILILYHLKFFLIIKLFILIYHHLKFFFFLKTLLHKIVFYNKLKE